MDYGVLIPSIFSAIGGSALGGFSMWRYFRRTLSSDQLTLSRNDAEISILKTLQEQAASAQVRADKAEKERTAALIQVGQLQGQIVVLSEHVSRLQTEQTATRIELTKARDEITQLNNYIREHIKP